MNNLNIPPLFVSLAMMAIRYALVATGVGTAATADTQAASLFGAFITIATFVNRF